MDIKDAYKVHHIKKDIYSGNINYSKKCIYCLYADSHALLNDGSFRKCVKCKKHFKAVIINEPIKNYNDSILK